MNDTNEHLCWIPDDRPDVAARAEVANCPMPDVMRVIGGKWKLPILMILIFRGTQRFGALRRQIEGITQTMLTGQLRALEADGLVTRTVHAEVPPRVEYTATQSGLDLAPVFLAMHEWWKGRLNARAAAE